MAKGQELTIEIGKYLKEYDRQVAIATQEAINKVAREAVKKLKETSPKNKGEYARSWALRQSTRAYHGVIGKTVYNKKGQLTHLLENGHVARNQFGTYGRVRAYVHIKPVEEWAKKALEDEITRRLNQ